jgi:hypothetical protein
MRDGTLVYSSEGYVGTALTEAEDTFALTGNASRTEGFPPIDKGGSASSSRPRPLLRERNHCMTLRALLVLAGRTCPPLSAARGTLSPSTGSFSDIDVGRAERGWRSEGSRERSFSRDGVSGSRVELRPVRTLIERAIGSTITLSVLRRFFLPLSGLSRDVWVELASTVGLPLDDDVTCSVEGRREVDPDILEMVVYSEVDADPSVGERAAWAGECVVSEGVGGPKIFPRPILSMERPLTCLPFLDEPEPDTEPVPVPM